MINPDDPKWTAYVLGELSEGERAQVEKELESSAPARDVVEEIRLTTAIIRERLAQEPSTTLSALQKQAITKAVSTRPKTRPVLRWAAAAGSIAAGVLIVIALSQPSLKLPLAGGSADLAPAPPSTPGQVRAEPAIEPEPAAAPLPTQKLEKDAAGITTNAPLDKAQEGRQGQQSQTVFGSPAVPTGSPAAPGLVSQAAGGRYAPTTLSFAENKLAAPAMAGITADRADRSRINTEAYDSVSDNPFIRVSQGTSATFSTDVDTASYADVRRFVTIGQLPPKNAVRIEEMINHFSYDYPSPAGRNPIGIYAEVAAAPWQPGHRLVLIGIKARASDISKLNDVKIQVEFNPAEVNAYRLIGYENRAVRHDEDRKDAGVMEAGQAVTGLFEIVPRGIEVQTAKSETLNIQVHYKLGEGSASDLVEMPVVDRGASFNNASNDFRFAAAVASFGMILRDSPYKGQSSLDAVIDVAEKSKGADRTGYREEFVQLVRRVRTLKTQ
jgi:hypothetical protein